MLVPRLLPLVGLAVAVAARAQAPAPDTSGAASRVVYQDTVQVVASKLRLKLVDLATTATVIGPAELRVGAARQLQDALGVVPGAHVIDLSGSETGGVVESRGFASQGTSSHALVLIDEIPINDSESGRVDWNLLAMPQVERIEFLRGPASFLYGNASMAGVVNLVTLGPGAGRTAWGEASGGSEGRVGGAGGASWSGTRLQGSLSGSWRGLEGYRDHSRWEAASGYASLRAALGSRWALRARGLGHRGNQEVPGPLPDPLWRTDPTQTQTPDDHRDDTTAELSLDLAGPLARDLDLSVLGSGETKKVDATETIVPVGAMDRTSRLHGARGELRLHWSPEAPFSPDLLVGGEYRTGSLESRYHDRASGAIPSGGGALVGAGDVDRTSGGVYALARARLVPSATLTGGVRVDWLRSSLDDPTDNAPRSPDDDLRAVSPTVGLNLGLPNAGHAWISYSESFKAPELEQLYDQRPYDLGFGPLRISSHALEPQRGDHWDAGASVALGSGMRADGAFFYARSREEIGFDLANFRYSNIDRSLHRGLEGQLWLEPLEGVTAQLSYAYTRATFEGGAHDGKQINTVPKHQLFLRATGRHPWNGSVTGEIVRVDGQWIDEDNQVPLPGYLVGNLALTQTLGPVEAFGSVRNVGDLRYATLGYVTLDQYGNDLPLYFPAGGRSWTLGLRMRVGSSAP